MRPTVFTHEMIVSDALAYSAHPHLVRSGTNDLVLVFNQSRRRERVLHPPNDPLFRNFIVRSSDSGRTWTSPRVAPHYDFSGTECAGLSALSNGTLLLHQWRYKWVNPEAVPSLDPACRVDMPDALVGTFKSVVDPEVMPWARALDGAYVHGSNDGGRTWTQFAKIATEPFIGGYGMRSCVELPTGDLIHALCDVPNWEATFVIRSSDRGLTWSLPTIAARVPGLMLEEPALALTPRGALVLMLRESTTDVMHVTRSHDLGATWSAPSATGLRGCPPHLLLLADGRLLCTYGYRYEPFQIRFSVSGDDGLSWSNPVAIRSDMGSHDIGYPSTVALSDGSLYTAYYAPDARSVSTIQATRWSLT